MSLSRSPLPRRCRSSVERTEPGPVRDAVRLGLLQAHAATTRWRRWAAGPSTAGHRRDDLQRRPCRAALAQRRLCRGLQRCAHRDRRRCTAGGLQPSCTAPRCPSGSRVPTSSPSCRTWLPASGLRVALVGGAPGVAEDAAARLVSQAPDMPAALGLRDPDAAGPRLGGGRGAGRATAGLRPARRGHLPGLRPSRSSGCTITVDDLPAAVLSAAGRRWTSSSADSGVPPLGAARRLSSGSGDWP